MLDVAPRRPRADHRGRQGRRRAARASRCSRRCSTRCAPATTTASSASSTSCRPGLRKSLYLKDDDYRLSLPLRELHHPHPLHRGRPRAGRHRAAEPAQRVASTPPTPTCAPRCCATGGAPPACAGCGRCSTTASRCTARSSCARASTTAPCSTTRSPACSTASPSWRRCASCPLGVSRYNTEARHARRTPSTRRRAVVDCVEDWQDVYLRVLGRRLVFVGDEYYLLAERPFPRRGRLRGLPDARGRRRHGPHARAGAVRREGRRHRHRRPGSSPGSTAPARPTRTTSPTAAPGPPPDQLLHVRPSRRAPVGDPDRHLRRAGAGAAGRSPRSATTCGSSRSTTEFFGGTTGGHRACWWGRTSPAPWPREPEGHRYLLPDVCLSNGRFLDGTAPEDLPRPVEVDRHRRPRPARRAGPRPASAASADDRPHRRRRRSPQRRQVDAGEPHRRPPRVTIVEEKPGVTRDRKEVDAEWQGVPFTLVDTGGWMPGGDSLDAKVSRQSEQAIRDADAVIMVMDAITGVTEEDSRVAEVDPQPGTRQGAPGRQQGRRRQPRGPDLGGLSLGLGRPARDQRAARAGRRRHARPPGRGAARSPSAAEDDDADDDAEADEERIFSVALVGRPNVGKSTLFNRLIGEDRAVVHDLPGTTRDTVDTIVETDEGPIRFVDTAGHAPQGQDRRGHRVLLAGAGAAGRRQGRRRPARSSTPPSASPPRTSGWPSASTRPAAPSWCC